MLSKPRPVFYKYIPFLLGNMDHLDWYICSIFISIMKYMIMVMEEFYFGKRQTLKKIKIALQQYFLE